MAYPSRCHCTQEAAQLWAIQNWQSETADISHRICVVGYNDIEPGSATCGHDRASDDFVSSRDDRDAVFIDEGGVDTMMHSQRHWICEYAVDSSTKSRRPY